MDPTSPYKNRGDIIEEKTKQWETSNDVTKAIMEKTRGVKKAQMLRHLVIKHGNEEKKETLVR